MLASALRGDVARRAFEDFQERLLYAFAAHVARDAHVLGLASDLINLVNVNDADLGALHVVVRRLEQAQDDIFHVLADVAGLGERGRVGDAEGDVENARERARHERLAAAGRADQEDVALVNLDLRERIIAAADGGADGAVVQDALVVVVHRDAERLLRGFLADDVVVELPADFRGLRHAELRAGALGLLVQFLVEDALADIDARVADVNARPCDQLSHFCVRFAAERAHGEIGSAGHCCQR